MPITTQFKKITKSKPFYAIAGAGNYVMDLARNPRRYRSAATTRITEFYDDLANRGRSVVGKASREAARGFEDVSRSAAPLAGEAPDKEPTRARRTASKV
ncbi:hypothetical protein [Microtetraspora malaysiensis]|uniref:Uncharacterized protein n=1 Tax=Microtetraspora malaysiensis TaxID=161358 RepID=A0ABW6T319_9ACTN